MIKYVFTESQIKKIIEEQMKTKSEDINEMKISGIVTDFLDEIKDFKDRDGLINKLGFENWNAMISYVLENDYTEFSKIRKESYDYINNYNN